MYRSPAIDSLLDLDFYKLTMGQFICFNHPYIPVTYSLINRRPEQRLADRIQIDELRDQLDHIRSLQFGVADIDYLRSLRGNRTGTALFHPDYLTFLQSDLQLPEVNIFMDKKTNDIGINVTGPWAHSVYWETLIMSTILELYFNQDASQEAHIKALDRLDEKIKLLREAKVPSESISDFGTRRRFQRAHQETILDVLNNRFKHFNTSNVYFSRMYGTTPIGTMAHELFMVLTALATLNNSADEMRQAHDGVFDEWLNMYSGNLAIALPDTYNSFTALDRMNYSTAYAYDGFRQDSGDPDRFADYLVYWYYNWGIDSRPKKCIFSDTLDAEQICRLYLKHKDLLTPGFGWGSTLMNDVGFQRLNIVVKATHVALTHLETVKISDATGKHLGSSELVDMYKNVFGG